MKALGLGTIDESIFFNSLRAIDLTQDRPPPFVSSIEGLAAACVSLRGTIFRWNDHKIVRVHLNTPLSGKLSIGVVARTPKGFKESIWLKAGGDTQMLLVGNVALPAYQLNLICRRPGKIIEFKIPGTPPTVALAYISIQMSG